MKPKFKNVNMDVKFMFGKYKGETLKYVYKNDIKYLQYFKEKKVFLNKIYWNVPINVQGRKLVRTDEYLEKLKIYNTLLKQGKIKKFMIGHTHTIEEIEKIFPDEGLLTDFIKDFETVESNFNKANIKYDGKYLVKLENKITKKIGFYFSKNKKNVIQKYIEKPEPRFCYYSHFDFKKYGMASFKIKFIKYNVADFNILKDDHVVMSYLNGRDVYNKITNKMIQDYKERNKKLKF